MQINNANTEKKQTQISDDKMDSEKIVIPAKQVIEQKNALQLILNRMNLFLYFFGLNITL